MQRKKNLSQSTLIERAKQFIPFLILQLQDEDLERLDREYSPEERERIALTMLLNPKEKWRELGVPDYLMKYEIVSEDEDEEE
jgi:hypothetical protein